MSNREYMLRLTHAPNGGWIIHRDGGLERPTGSFVAAYSNKDDMFAGLSDVINEIEKSHAEELEKRPF